MFDFKEKLSEIETMIVTGVNVEFDPGIKNTEYLYINKENLSAKIKIRESCQDTVMKYYDMITLSPLSKDDIPEEDYASLVGANFMDEVNVSEHVVAIDEGEQITLRDILDDLNGGVLSILYDKTNKVITFCISYWACNNSNPQAQINVDLHYKLQVFSDLSTTDIFSKLESYGGETAFTVMPYDDEVAITYKFAVYDVENTFDIINDIANLLI